MATVTKGRTFTSGETVTPAKLNDVVDLATVTEIVNADIKSDAAIAGSKLADGGVTPAKLSQPLTLATAQATTSGTSIDFTGIPSWVKRVTVILNQISTNGNSRPQIQIGSSSVATSGYLSSAFGGSDGNAAFGLVSTTGFVLVAGNNSASYTHQGQLRLLHLGSNVWTANGSFSVTNGAIRGFFIDGTVTLSGALDRIRLTTVAGTDTFDSGSMNILYEG